MLASLIITAQTHGLNQAQNPQALFMVYKRGRQCR